MSKNKQSHLMTEKLTVRISEDRREKVERLAELKSEYENKKVSMSAVINEAIEEFTNLYLSKDLWVTSQKELDDREVMTIRFYKDTKFNVSEIENIYKLIEKTITDNDLEETTSAKQFLDVIEAFYSYASLKVKQQKEAEQLKKDIARLEKELGQNIKLHSKYDY